MPRIRIHLQIAVFLVSFAASHLGGKLRDIQKDGCEGEYRVFGRFFPYGHRLLGVCCVRFDLSLS